MKLGPIRRRVADAAARAGLCPACGRGDGGAGRGTTPAEWAADDGAFRGLVNLLWLVAGERHNQRIAVRADPVDEPGLRPLLDGLLAYIHASRGKAG